MRAINKHSTKPFSREDMRVAIELWMPKVSLATIRKQLMVDWMRHILELWTTKMSDIDYLRTLVERMHRRLKEVIQRGEAATKY
jgi:hypothetical protein